MKALVLAAGMGSRIAGVADGVPKPLIQVGGMPVIVRNLLWLRANGIEDIWVNLHHRPDEIRAVVGDGQQFGVQVRYSYESALLGTAGAAKKLEEQWDDAFVVVYGDNIVGFDLRAMCSRHRRCGADATIAVFDPAKDMHSGIAGGRVCMGEGDRVEGFSEGNAALRQPDVQWVNAGVYVLSHAVCGSIPEGKASDFGKDVFPALLTQGLRVMGYPINSHCLAVDTPEALRETERICADADFGFLMGCR